jgi:hypothetical protein
LETFCACELEPQLLNVDRARHITIHRLSPAKLVSYRRWACRSTVQFGTNAALSLLDVVTKLTNTNGCKDLTLRTRRASGIIWETEMEPSSFGLPGGATVNVCVREDREMWCSNSLITLDTAILVVYLRVNTLRKNCV